MQFHMVVKCWFFVWNWLGCSILWLWVKVFYLFWDDLVECER